MSKKKFRYKPQGDYLILEKIKYDEEITTTSGIIYKKSQTLDSNYIEAKIIDHGPGLPLPTGEVFPLPYKKGDTILYDVRGRIGLHDDFDIIRNEHVIAVVVE